VSVGTGRRGGVLAPCVMCGRADYVRVSHCVPIMLISSVRERETNGYSSTPDVGGGKPMPDTHAFDSPGAGVAVAARGTSLLPKPLPPRLPGGGVFFSRSPPAALLSTRGPCNISRRTMLHGASLMSPQSNAATIHH